MQPANAVTENWNFAKKTGFRLSFCFFIFQFFLGSALYVFIFGFNFAIYNWFEKLYAPVYSYVNNHFLHLRQTATRLTVNGFLFFIISIVISIIATILWTVFDQQRKSYVKADFWLRHILTYVLAIIMFSYGIDKLIPVQMSVPGTDYLYARVGSFPPSSLFWTLMGSHTFYESFTGLIEIMAALLLVFSGTYVIGLIVLAGTLINVLMLNISFDIGVTYFVIVLLMAVIIFCFPTLIPSFIFYSTSNMLNFINSRSQITARYTKQSSLFQLLFLLFPLYLILGIVEKVTAGTSKGMKIPGRLL